MISPFDIAEAAVMAKALAEWLKGGDLDRLLDLLDRRFGDETGLSLTQLESWREDEDFTRTLFAISYTADWDTHREALRSAVLALTADDPRSPTQDEQALCDDVVAAMEELLPLAKRGDALVRYEAQQLHGAIEGVTAKPLRSDWAPDRAQDFVNELADRSPEEALKLQETLLDQDPAAIIPGLIRNPPAWIGRDGSGLLYEALAATAEGLGQWDVALAAWKQGAERAGADRARALVRGSTAAYVLGMRGEGDALLAAGETVDPEHPAVLFAKTQSVSDPAEKLKLIERVVPRKDRHVGAQKAARAEALAEMGRISEAREELRAAQEAGVDALRLRDVEAELVLNENRAFWLRGDAIDVQALVSAADSFLALRDKHRELHAYRGSPNYIGKAGEAYLRAGETEKLLEILAPDSLLEEELEAPGARETCAELLVKAGRPDLAIEFLPEEKIQGRPAEVVRAMAIAHAGEGHEVQAAIETLDAEIADGEHRLPAAVTRLGLAGASGHLWSEEAEALVADADPTLAALLKAQYLAGDEQWSEAERVLDLHASESRVQHALIQLALQEGDEAKVKTRAESALRGSADHSIRFDAAGALLRTGALAEARRELERLREDAATPEPIRVAALGNLAQLANDSERYSDVLKLTAEWLELRPTDESPIWGRMHALFRLGGFTDAAELLDQYPLEPRRIEDARLLARVISLGISGEEGLRRIIELADAQAEPDEDLEAIAMFTAMAIPARLPDEVLQRVNVERFIRTFPNTNVVQAISAPTTEDEIRSFIRELTEGRAAAIAAVEQEVFKHGTTPTATLALAAGRHVGELWRQLARRPTGFGEPTLDDLETANASAGLSLGAVWDPSSLFTVTALGEHFEALVRQVLPRSVLPQASLDDLLAEAPDIASGDEQTVIGSDESGEPWVRVIGREDVARERAQAEAMNRLARQLDPEPNAPPDDDGPEAKLMRNEDLPPQLETYGATFSVARRLGLPVFSDDRLVRLRARQAGIRAFGTAAIINALERRGDIGPADRMHLRRNIHALGVTGSNLDADELIDQARSSRYLLSHELIVTLWDPLLIRTSPSAGLQRLVEFLRAVYHEAPERFDIWVARVLDLSQQPFPLAETADQASRLMVLGWQFPTETDHGFLAALTTALRQAVRDLAGLGANGIAAQAAALINAALRLHGAPLAFRLQVLAVFIDQLPPDDRHSVWLKVLGDP